MTAAQPLHPSEPPPPQRGLSREERGRDVSEAQAEAEAERSGVRRFLRMMSPRYVWSMAEGYPVVLKQFIQFCLILIYPAWVFAVLMGAAVTGLFYITVYPILWLLFWPARAYQKKNNPEEYAASRAKYKGKKWYET
jgi:YggT family protein